MNAERECFPQEIERVFLVTSLPENVHWFAHDQIRQGYVVIAGDESEVRSVSESQNFAPPFWFNQEVTENARYKNQNLAQHGVPDPRSVTGSSRR